MAFVTNPGGRQCSALSLHFRPVPASASCLTTGWEGWHAGTTGMLCCRHLSGEVQAARLDLQYLP